MRTSQCVRPCLALAPVARRPQRACARRIEPWLTVKPDNMNNVTFAADPQLLTCIGRVSDQSAVVDTGRVIANWIINGDDSESR